MDSNGKFWLCIWALLAFVIIVISALIAVNVQNARNAMTDMVRAGADPIAVACALDSSTRNDVCLLVQRK
jgi:hypothetical protein